MTTRTIKGLGFSLLTVTSTLLLLVLQTPAHAGGHTWRVNEVFSNSDGTIQFIEIRECCGLPNETGLSGHSVRSAATGMQFPLTQNLAAGTTANAHILFGTAAFAALPGAPAPDFIINDNFIGLNGDTINYFPNGGSDIAFLAGELPIDGVLSLHDDGAGFLVLANTPTNFLGVTATIDAGGNNPIPEVSLDLGASAAPEGGGAHGVNVVLGGLGSGNATTEAITVMVADNGSGTATAGSDYSSFGTQLVTIAIGAVDGDLFPVTLDVLDDALPEGSETVSLDLVSATGMSAVLGATIAHIVTILDDDGPPPATEFIRGDINQDGSINIADPIRALEALFVGNPTTCNAAEDLNDDGNVNIGDPIYQLGSLFSMGDPPPPPFPGCGLDPTPDALICASHTQCP
mgnify:FL=1